MLIVIDLFKSPSITNNNDFWEMFFILFISSKHVFVCFSNKKGGLCVTPPPPLSLWFQVTPSTPPPLFSPNNAWRGLSRPAAQLTQNSAWLLPRPPFTPAAPSCSRSKLLAPLQGKWCMSKNNWSHIFLFPNRNYTPPPPPLRTPPSTPNFFVFSIPVHEGLGCAGPWTV